MSTPPVFKMRRRVSPATRFVTRAGRSAAIFFAVALIAMALLAASSSASFYRHGGRTAPAVTGGASARAAVAAKPASGPQRGTAAVMPSLHPALLLQSPPPPPAPDAVATYDRDCSTPKTSFQLGDTVCAQVTGGPSLSVIPRRLALVDAAGNVRSVYTITSDPQTVSITLPSTQTTTDGTSTFDNRGTWKVNVVPGSRLSVRTSANFEVSDPQNPVVDLVVYNSNNTGGTTTVGTSGTDVTFSLWVTNHGPDAASNVQVTNVVPAGTTFVSESQDAGPTFTCTNPSAGDAAGTTTCTIDSLAPGATAKFNLGYQILGGAAAGSDIADTAAISSDTAELNILDNSETSVIQVVSGAAQACTITCHDNITAPATTTVNNQRGAFVSFSSATVVGDCGSVSASPASGAFFPVGATTVNVTSDGGGSCSFTVTVTDSAPPTISCPDNVTKAAPDGSCDTTVSAAELGTPTTTGNGVIVTAVRSDGLELTDPFPRGQTTVTWTATDSQGATATCPQTVTVTTTTNSHATVTAPPDVTVGTGPDATTCAVALGDDDLGAATAEDACGSVNVTRSGVPAGGLFPKGTTTITYTAVGGDGQPATATQKVTVVDNTKPIIFAPADASYTCLEQVPAASPSQAGGPVLDTNGQPALDANGNLIPGGQPFDNCGAPTVTVSDSATGAGTAADPRVITRTYTATDGSGNSSSAVQTITVTDSTPPTIAAPAGVTAYTGAGATSCDTVVSNATLGTATASDNCAGVTVTRSPAGNTFPVGDTTVTWTATDAVGNTATATQTVTVVDNTPPTIAAPAGVTLYTGPGATSCGVTVSNLDATLGTATASDNCAGLGAVTRSGVPAGNAFPVGTTTVTYSVTDAHGNSSSAAQTVTVIDNTPPVVTPPPSVTVYLPLNSTATSMAVTYPNPATATDNCAGPITITYNPASGSVFPVGTTTVTVTATDVHGNSSTTTFTVTVLYDFTGFLAPVNNLPTFNVVNAGRAVPVKFSLSGNKGLNIFAANSPQSGVIACDGSAPAIDLTDTVTAGGSSLSYDASSDQYNYVWKTESSWAGTCRQLVVTLNDGSVHTANFKFK
jgi:uncharacterized repeat protein (TIGR01451 family)